MRIVTSLLFVLMLAGCSQTIHQPEPKASARFEVITREQQTLEAVQVSPTEFRVPAERETIAWQRARLFFSQYLGENTPQVTRLSPNGMMMTSASNAAPYFYKVEKYPSKGGEFNYLVSCQAGGRPGDRNQASLNAKNLARFISQGQLEVSLLAR